MMRCALFARYSSKMQDELSLEAQVHEMEVFAAKQGWEVTARYLLPETRSCELQGSPEYQQMLEDAKAKRFQVLLVHKLDRFGRDKEQAVMHKGYLRRRGIQVRSVVENLGDTSMDRAMEGMLEVMAEWYSANLAQETRKGHRALVRRGCWTGGKPPWGLATEATPEGHKRLVPHPWEAPIMVEVFRQLAGGATSGQLLDLVEERTGTRWTHLALYARVRNPVYKGVLEYGRTTMPQGRPRRRLESEEVTQGTWEGLVSSELWAAANEVLASRGQQDRRPKAPAQVYLLAELASCSSCGRPLVGGMHEGTRRYYCSGRRLSERCRQPSTRADTLEGLVLALARQKLRTTPAELEQDMRLYAASLQPEILSARTRQKRLRKRLDEIRKKIRNLVLALAEGLVDRAVHQVLAELREEEGQVAEEMARSEVDAQGAVALNVDYVRARMATMAEELETQDLEALKRLLQLCFRVIWDAQQKRGQLIYRLTPQVPQEIGRGKSMVGVLRPKTCLGPVFVWDLAA